VLYALVIEEGEVTRDRRSGLLGKVWPPGVVTGRAVAVVGHGPAIGALADRELVGLADVLGGGHEHGRHRGEFAGRARQDESLAGGVADRGREVAQVGRECAFLGDELAVQVVVVDVDAQDVDAAGVLR
jgi:hypothetical protein